ncbi:serine/threonine-protein kinase [Streptomyces gobitricini]|uniref:non-specific serine/threonine protein kinase n=1 Tax=Streptomyces gobitricini TaxID=68211 RepID=A0ABP5Z730_9ACTN
MGETRLLQGRYRLEKVIGRGGMGEVWRATDEALGRRVAVKCLKPLGPQQDRDLVTALRERFRREARVAAALQHRGVTVVHDFGESDGLLYLVMELLEGRNLSQLLEDNEQHPLPVHVVVDIAEQVADALAHTHRQGIVHRDLKPANIMRLDDGTVKICDFGIARIGADVGFTARLTGTGIAMGTPHYMSPEQISGDHVDHRSDLYSLGCVLYEIATGVPPFDLDDAWAVLVGHRDTPPEPLRNHRAELPEFFERAVLDLLAKTPDGRPTDAADLRRRITAAHPARTAVLHAPFPPAPTHPRAPHLPSWTRGMSTGHKAVGTTLLHAAPPPDPSAGLTGRWTTSTDPRGTVRPAPGRVGDRVPPRTLDHLAGRHSAGLSLGRLGRWEKAGEVHRAVAAEREHALGPDHPDTLTSRYEAGFALSRTGRDADALREFGRVAEGRDRVLGPDHPDTLTARQEMAYALGRLGRHAEAHQVYTSVLDARTRTMGADHPDTLRCRHHLAFNLGRLGRPEEAYRTAYEVAAARARLLGPEHPDTLLTRYEVAYTLGRLGRWTEALRTYREVASVRARALGPDHPDTLAARHGVGTSLGRLGLWAEALLTHQRVAEARDRVLGAAHPDALASRDEEAHCLRRLGRRTEAVELYRRVAELRGRGGGHWRTGADACYEGP